MKNFLLTLFPNLTAKAAITAAICVTAGAAVTATATTVAYNKKAASYEQTIDSLEAAQSETKAANTAGEKGNSPEAATAVRVVDGMLQVWDGEKWDEYGSVDDIVSGDPFYGNDEKKQEVEQSVAAKKLDELGLTVNEQGEIVRKEDAEGTQQTADKKDTVILVGSVSQSGGDANNGSNKNSKGKSTDSSKTASTPAASASTAGLTPEMVMAAIQGGGIASAPIATQTVTTVSWTASSSGSSGGGSDSGWSEPVQSQPAQSQPDPQSTPAQTETQTTTDETPVQTEQPAFNEETGDDIQ